MIVHYHTHQGLAHTLSGEPCQDSVAIAEGERSKGVYALALADGASNYAHTKEGGSLLAKRAAKLMAIGFQAFMKVNDESVLKQFRILIRNTLKDLRQRYPDEGCNAFASTLLVCGFMPRTGEYLALQLGDGAVIVEDKVGIHRAIFPYENGNYSYLTTSPLRDLRAQMKLCRGQANSVMLTSDGAAEFLYSEGGDVTPWTSWLLKTARYCTGPNFKALLEEFLDDECHIVDDFSLGLLSCGVPQTLPVETSPQKIKYYKKMRRAARAYHKFSLARESGLQVLKAARRAGWGRRNRKRKMLKTEELMLWKTIPINAPVVI